MQAAVQVRIQMSTWEALLCYCDDSRLEIDNNAAERSLRAVVLGRRNYLFNGAETLGRFAAVWESRGLTEGAPENASDLVVSPKSFPENSCRR